MTPSLRENPALDNADAMKCKKTGMKGKIGRFMPHRYIANRWTVDDLSAPCILCNRRRKRQHIRLHIRLHNRLHD